MGRLVGRYVAPEMALLWLFELLVASGVVYAVPLMFATFDPTRQTTVPDITPWPAERIGLVCATIGAIAVMIGLYRPDICLDRRRLVLNAALVAILAFPAALITDRMFADQLVQTYSLWYCKILVIWLVCVLTTRSLLQIGLIRTLFVRRLLVIGAAPGCSRVAAMLRTRRGGLFELAGTLDATDAACSSQLTAEGLREQRAWGLVIVGDASNLPDVVAGRLLDCKLRGIRVFDERRFCEQQLGRINVEHAALDSFLTNDGFDGGQFSGACKRCLDLLVSATLLFLTLPLMLAVGLAVRLDSSGPALYRQERVGLRGRTFTLLKFRSMRSDAEIEGRPRWAVLGDPRITRVGAFIRASRIDELPQLLNVLRGDMSLVGPRPERPLFVERLAEAIPFYRLRDSVRPGITGWAQINYPYGASAEDAREKLAFDIYYIKNRSLALDLLILFLTIRVVLFREGAR